MTKKKVTNLKQTQNQMYAVTHVKCDELHESAIYPYETIKEAYNEYIEENGLPEDGILYAYEIKYMGSVQMELLIK